MNERIRELEDQAGYIQVDDRFSGGYITFDIEKFALLIVRECIAQCEKNAEHSYLGPGSKLSAFNIREHFGVAE